jgi:NAD(P)-dependent dehydrogenase (short-subunit alcohol dehydrogenase family)
MEASGYVQMNHMKSVGALVMELEGKIALVTGAGGGGAGGQGRVIALALAAEGADVAANDINLELAEATASEVQCLNFR